MFFTWTMLQLSGAQIFRGIFWHQVFGFRSSPWKQQRSSLSIMIIIIVPWPPGRRLCCILTQTRFGKPSSEELRTPTGIRCTPANDYNDCDDYQQHFIKSTYCTSSYVWISLTYERAWKTTIEQKVRGMWTDDRNWPQTNKHQISDIIFRSECNITGKKWWD